MKNYMVPFISLTKDACGNRHHTMREQGIGNAAFYLLNTNWDFAKIRREIERIKNALEKCTALKLIKFFNGLKDTQVKKQSHFSFSLLAKKKNHLSTSRKKKKKTVSIFSFQSLACCMKKEKENVKF